MLQPGDLVDVRPLLDRLEEVLRQRVVANTSLFALATTFGPNSFPGGSGPNEKQLKGYFTPGGGLSADCHRAIDAIFAKAVTDVLKPGEFSLLFANNAWRVPLKRRANISVGEMRLGDHGYFANFSDYKLRHPKGYSTGHNFIKVDACDYWTHGVGVKDQYGHEKDLVDAYNSGLPQLDHRSLETAKLQDADFGFLRVAQFIDVDLLAARVLDRRQASTRAFRAAIGRKVHRDWLMPLAQEGGNIE